MAKIIKSSEIPGGCCIGSWYDKIKKQNENVREDIDTCGKKYKYLGPVKSTTKVFGWRVTDGERFFCANHCHYHGCSSIIYVYQTNKNGEFDCIKPIAEYPNYTDIETVLDLFFETYVPSDEEFNYEEKEIEIIDDEKETDEAKSLELK